MAGLAAFFIRRRTQKEEAAAAAAKAESEATAKRADDARIAMAVAAKQSPYSEDSFLPAYESSKLIYGEDSLELSSLSAAVAAARI